MKFCNIIDCDKKFYAMGLCKNHYEKQRYIKNPKYQRKYSKKWKDNNPKKVKEQNKKYFKNHPEIFLKSMKKHLKKHGKIFNMNSMEYSFALQSWSKTIKKIDNYTCKNCGSKKNLNAHHIMPKNKFPIFSLDLDNGITLCKRCHGELHGYRCY